MRAATATSSRATMPDIADAPHQQLDEDRKAQSAGCDEHVGQARIVWQHQLAPASVTVCPRSFQIFRPRAPAAREFSRLEVSASGQGKIRVGGQLGPALRT